MTDTKLASVDSWVMSEVLSTLDLKPLRSRFVTLPFLNTSSIDGLAAEDRKIRKSQAIANAVADTEAETFTAYEEYLDDTPIELTPTGFIQGVRASLKSLRRALPGATRDQVIEAVTSGNPEALPMLSAIALEILFAHYKTAELAANALFSGLSKTGGVTNTALTVAAIIDASTQLLEGKPDHRGLVGVIGTHGIGQLKLDIEATDSTLYSKDAASALINELGQSAGSASTPFGNIAGVTIYEADDDLLPDANGTTDNVGAIFCAGRGETAAPGSLRGFAEFCEGHNLRVQLDYELDSDTVKAIGRYEWDVKEHTDLHGIKLLYKAA